MTDRRIVLDSSVGVKWFKPEAGSTEAYGLLAEAIEEAVVLVAPVHFAHEVLSVVRRHYAPRDVMPAWERLEGAGLVFAPLTREQVAEAAAQCASLDCSFYDALAPALASLLDAELVSADERAHGAYPGVRIVG